jgi:hypothetical protein
MSDHDQVLYWLILNSNEGGEQLRLISPMLLSVADPELAR